MESDDKYSKTPLERASHMSPKIACKTEVAFEKEYDQTSIINKMMGQNCT